MMSMILRFIGFIGTLVFGLLISVTFVSPKAVEQSAKEFIKHQIEKEVRLVSEAESQSTVTKKALDIAGRLGLEKQKIHEDLMNKLPEKIANVIASLCGYDCEKKKALTQSITLSYLTRIKNIKVAQDTLGHIIKGKYLEIVGQLKLDLRIFFCTNFFMFIAILIISFFKPQAIAHLFLPAILLFFATILSSILYIVGQDWFYIILYNDYLGFAYIGYISVVFGFLLDVTINKARITTEAINGVARALCSGVSVSPC